MNTVLGEEDGRLSAKVLTEEDKQMPPVKGWRYRGGSKWVWLWQSDDPTLECSEIVVELQGAAMEKWPGCAGSYLPVKGQINRGRWVGSYQQHSLAFNNCH